MKEQQKPLQLVYFAGEGIFSPVLDSQVLMPLRLLGRHAPHIRRHILFLTSHRYRKQETIAPRQEQIRRMLEGVQIQFRYRPVLGLPVQAPIWAHLLRRALAAWRLPSNEPVVVHCRGTSTGAAAARLKRRDGRLRLLVDVRGDVSDEIRRNKRLRWYGWMLPKNYPRTALRAADGLNTVTARLAARLDELGILPGEVPRIVVGCCADTQRFYFDPAERARRRRELGLEDKFVVCYCGALQYWQKPDALAEAFAAIRHEMPDAHMLVISREPEALYTQLAQRGVPEEAVTARSVGHDEVAPHMMAADVALLLRDDIPTNQVASPVKFAEYLRCGLPVILTPYIGDFGVLIQEEGVGEAVTLPLDRTQLTAGTRRLRQRLEQEGESFRQRCSEVAAARLSWDGRLPQLVDLYHKLAAAEQGGGS
ncbi:MAG: glycosyltransferase [Phycisphaerales bacterium]|nr:MAG: glycosyltransferase [Phycisphaerales bacterium]